ncbi:DUF2306 domain-containing protein [Sphingomonas sp. 28-63-12]|uniref:DUF2306 domain-containing protein n=1 Tax=Sphingomonas sp. 28-63-12 TaxID=1970434 RepID=UPI000BDA9EDE|nr:MAG: hypothetical protein B7Y47_06105 [Sphingomonas sp. 28-63-12]
MATKVEPKLRQQKPLGADRFERFLAIGAIVLLGCVIVALAKGQPYWAKIPINVWGHLGAMIVALALTPVMLLRRRGDRPHRLLGTIWVGAMLLTALISLTVRNSNHGNFSIIHILSVWVLIQVPLLWWSARTHRIARHRAGVRGMVFGALLIAGFFTFPFNRMLGQFLFS